MRSNRLAQAVKVVAPIAFFLLVTGQVKSQIIWPPVIFSPAAPTSQDRIEARFSTGCSALSEGTAVSGNVIRTTVRLYCTGLPGEAWEHVERFGPVPAGTYTYEVIYTAPGSTPELRSQQPLVIAPAPGGIPLFDDLVLLLLIATLGGMAVWTLKPTPAS